MALWQERATIRRVTRRPPVTPNRWGKYGRTEAHLRGGAAAPIDSGRWQRASRAGRQSSGQRAGHLRQQARADAWLASQTRDVGRGVWAPRSGVPVSARCAFGTTQTLARRPRPEASTRALYRDLLDDLILPTLATTTSDKIHANDGADVARPAREQTPPGERTPTRCCGPYALPPIGDEIISANTLPQFAAPGRPARCTNPDRPLSLNSR